MPDNDVPASERSLLMSCSRVSCKRLPLLLPIPLLPVVCSSPVNAFTKAWVGTATRT